MMGRATDAPAPLKDDVVNEVAKALGKTPGQVGAVEGIEQLFSAPWPEVERWEQTGADKGITVISTAVATRCVVVPKSH